MAGGRRSTTARTARPPCVPPPGAPNLLSMSVRSNIFFWFLSFFLDFNSLFCIQVRKPEDPEPLAASQYPQAVPIPDIPHDSSLTFEVIMFSYVTAALGLQYLNLYR